jgi:hypothetical protein
MPSHSDLTANLTYAELADIVDENGEPFETVEQCKLYLRAASMLRRRVPEESEQSGERLRTRDLLEGIKEARKWMSIYLLSSEKPQAITPGELG